jgi:molybdopterin-guanine dinucleotide biosynthesis protein A
MPSDTIRCAGVVLAGGQSRRMGQPKTLLPFGPETMLQRVVQRLGEAVAPIVVAARAEQHLPALPAGVRVVFDRQPNRGPLEGMAAAFASLVGLADAAFVTGCDVPLLDPRFVRRMMGLLDDYEIAVPSIGGYDEPLLGVYRLEVLPQIRAALAAGRLRVAALFDTLSTRRIPPRELQIEDLSLESLENVNTPADYRAALQRLFRHS